jgi:spore photoproduct lyase
MDSNISLISNNIQKKFPFFGINKIRELTRLVFEISKRDNISSIDVINSIQEKSYEKVKEYLLQKRYPRTYGISKKENFYLPDITLTNEQANLISEKFNPKNVYYTKEVTNSFLYNRIKTLYPNATFTEIESLKSFLKEQKFSVAKYNNRRKNLFLVNEKYDFFKPCPCTKNVKCCNYSILNIGYGCLYECSYCFLQGYQNVAGIILPCNLPNFLSRDKIKPADNKMFFLPRVGSGEFTDSLIFDDVTLFSNDIVKFFKENTDISFEFKTKSTNIDNLLKLGGSKNIVVSWSVNAEQMIKENEHCTPGLQERLTAAQKCVKAGYSVGFHFDPVILYEDWKQGYKKTIENIFDFIDGKYIKWISIGSLRMVASLKKVIETRFPDNRILDEELLLSHDNKLRYDDNTRIKIYRYLVDLIKKQDSSVVVYLCMENTDIWNKVYK